MVQNIAVDGLSRRSVGPEAGSESRTSTLESPPEKQRSAEVDPDHKKSQQYGKRECSEEVSLRLLTAVSQV